MAERTQTALVFQGGGAAGAYHLGVFSYLHEAGLQPDIVTGSSIGAITAAVIVGTRAGDPLADLDAVWKEFTVGAPFLTSEAGRAISSVVNFGMFHPRFDIWAAPTWTALLSNNPLRSTLVRHVDFDKLNESSTAFAVSAIDVQTGCIEYFRNRGNAYVSLDDIVASGSMPPNFPMTEIDGKSYWDGGVFDPNPIEPALEFFGKDPQTRRRLIVVAPAPGRTCAPTSFTEVSERVIELQIGIKVKSELSELRRRNQILEVIQDLGPETQDRFAKAFPGPGGLDTASYLDEIIHIDNPDPRVSSNVLDFSAASIRRRTLAGYEDARNAMQDTALAS
ncbi:MAG: patatin-like phospholipase family protein [Pseudomonadota bacterium]